MRLEAYPAPERVWLDPEARRFFEGAAIALVCGLVLWAAAGLLIASVWRAKRFDPPGMVVRAASIQQCHFRVRPFFYLCRRMQ